MLAGYILGSHSNRVFISLVMKRLANFYLVLNGIQTPTQLVTKHSMLQLRDA